MKLKYYIMVDVVTHNLKLKSVAKMTNWNKTDNVKIKQVYVGYKFHGRLIEAIS